VTDPGDPSRSGSPRDLIVTIFGVFARSGDGSLSVASLIRLLADLGVPAGAVRSSVARLKKREVLEAVAGQGGARYRPGPLGRAAIAQGDDRIYQPIRAEVEDGWVLAVFSVPEDQRDRRHQLRTALARLGFGTVVAGVWAAPAHLAATLRRELDRLELGRFVEVMVTRAPDQDDARRQVASWWDVPRLQFLYEDFISDVTSLLARGGASASDDREAFRDYLRVLTRWRRLPFIDPGLPLEALPRDWPGEAAWHLFLEARGALEPGAVRHARSVLGEG
jgi:phenylacetic acid degradation operon negative regulatory protein